MALCPTRMKMNPFSSDRKLSGKCPVKKTQEINKCNEIPHLISPLRSKFFAFLFTFFELKTFMSWVRVLLLKNNITWIIDKQWIHGLKIESTLGYLAVMIKKGKKRTTCGTYVDLINRWSEAGWGKCRPRMSCYLELGGKDERCIYKHLVDTSLLRSSQWGLNLSIVELRIFHYDFLDDW